MADKYCKICGNVLSDAYNKSPFCSEQCEIVQRRQELLALARDRDDGHLTIADIIALAAEENEYMSYGRFVAKYFV